MTAHPPRTRWHVETYYRTDAVWVPGEPLDSRQAAVNELARLADEYPTWPDGTVTARRIVLETTTYTDLTTEPGPFRLPKGGFVLTDTSGQDLAAVPGETPDGWPAVRLVVGSSEVGHAETTVPLDRLEEVIAGMRDTARQAGARCDNANCAGSCPGCYRPPATDRP
ncbi:hypothetical protein [Streptomyces sp. NPDC002467]|uniref:hypothetical protein n=1 Tax=Streptomyces sp. NPDC002467 TaxID=3364647 RepID=UPI00369CFA03